MKDDAVFRLVSGNCVEFIDLETASKIIYYNRNGLINSVVQCESIRELITAMVEFGMSQLEIL